MTAGLRRFSVWKSNEGGGVDEIAMTTGGDIPRFANGTPVSDENTLLFTIDARTWDEAKAIMNLRLGWEPYRPLGEPQDCPRCSSKYWPESYGECWSWGYAA